MRSPRPGVWIRVGSILFLILIVPSIVRADDVDSLTIRNINAYQEALQPLDPSEAPPLVRFRDLWENPDEFLGRQLRIEGIPRRRFRQEAIGELPPLVELWIASSQGNLTCLVYPKPRSGDQIPLGRLVHFTGTSLGRIQYDADQSRVAPLLVGPEPPRLIKASDQDRSESTSSLLNEFDWLLGLIAVLLVCSTLARVLLLRPQRRRRSLLAEDQRPNDHDPRPVFIDQISTDTTRADSKPST